MKSFSRAPLLSRRPCLHSTQFGVHLKLKIGVTNNIVNGNWITPCTCRHPDRTSVLLSEEHVAYNTSIPCHYRKWMPLYSHCPVMGVSRQIRLCKEIPLLNDTKTNPVHMNTLLVCCTGECNLHCSLEPRPLQRGNEGLGSRLPSLWTVTFIHRANMSFTIAWFSVPKEPSYLY